PGRRGPQGHQGRRGHDRRPGRGLIMTAMRDAAVDPESSDFLPPTNAGDEDPHGPLVISPGIHGEQGMHPVTPGAVSSSATTQEAAETAHMVSFQAAIESLSITPATIS